MSDSRFNIGRWMAAAFAMLCLAAAIYNVVLDNKPKGDVVKIKGYTAWSEEILRVAEIIPLQDGGRTKPLSTYAGFTMLSLHGARSMKIEGDHGTVLKVKPTAWMLDSLFRPQFAIQQPTFRVDNSSALEAIGVTPKGRRDRYSYQEIEKGRAKLMELAQTYQSIDSKQRDPIQNQLVDLSVNFQHYERLLGYFTFARQGVLLSGFGENEDTDKRADVSALMVTAPQLREHIQQAQAKGEGINPRLRALLQQVLDSANFAKFGLSLFPPLDPKIKSWKSAGDTIMGVMTGASSDIDLQTEDITVLETLGRATGDDASFVKALTVLHERIRERANSRGEYRFIELEAAYYRKDWFLTAMILFLLGTLSALGMWTLGKSPIARALSWVTIGLSISGLVCCVTAIVKRCIIMQRPPIGNLYDTVIFIAAAIVLLSLITEWMTRRRFALGIGPILGTALVLLARRFEVGDAKDHMDPLVAVLDSNYWLTTHVITITMGYSAGLLSAFLSAAYVLMRGLGLDGGDREIRRAFTRTVYGMICFTLFLSLIGTVLGGIWANDSWGRFWGWDPKENGALLIVLWTLSILHARLGGYLREWGLHFAAMFTAVVVTFSWWHVNFLGVGLHNYGFTAGKNAIWIFYIVMLLMLSLGVIAMLVEKESARKHALKPVETE